MASLWSSADSGGTVLSIMAKVEKQNLYRSLNQLPADDIADAFLTEISHPEGKLVSFAGSPPMYDCTSVSHVHILLLIFTGFT